MLRLNSKALSKGSTADLCYLIISCQVCQAVTVQVNGFEIVGPSHLGISSLIVLFSAVCPFRLPEQTWPFYLLSATEFSMLWAASLCSLSKGSYSIESDHVVVVPCTILALCAQNNIEWCNKFVLWHPGRKLQLVMVKYNWERKKSNKCQDSW